MTETLINAARGETVMVIDGKPHRLCLTLGALAEIETALGATEGGLSERLQALSARDILLVLLALLRGGGSPLKWDDVARADLTATDAAHAVAAAFEAAVSDGV